MIPLRMLAGKAAGRAGGGDVGRDGDGDGDGDGDVGRDGDGDVGRDGDGDGDGPGRGAPLQKRKSPAQAELLGPGFRPFEVRLGLGKRRRWRPASGGAVRGPGGEGGQARRQGNCRWQTGPEAGGGAPEPPWDSASRGGDR
ncbi:MAG: hypothetical protein LBQ12_05155, partial [Deltaproteobacteria bacterium]|nr:hypothetical protein [Deltaproteobacteria bacterium]